ncbi:MAG: Gfo/Idh/MocA family oxidoreductase [Thermoguttaceae bacterium]|jgi:predicted dehydrogenase
MSEHETLPRRQFLNNVASAAASASVLGAGLAAAAEQAAPRAALERKIKVGIVGCGGRGSWIAGLFKQHGGYEFVAAADYFPDRAEKTGTSLGADKAKCFSGLSAYKRLIQSGVEAVILETPPYFFPEHAAAAVEAGLHVYMAKPVAVDVPGTLAIGAAGKAATEKKRVFLVDYQMWTDPMNLEVCKRLREGGLGTLQMVFSVGTSGGGGFNDPPLTGNLENRLTGLIWVNDDALGCGYIGNFDIHAIDAIVWALGKRPVSAYGKGGRFRKDPHGDAFDTNFVTYTFDDGLAWNHHSAQGPSHDWLKQGSLEGSIQGSEASARLSYWGKAYVRGGPKHFGGGQVADLYDAGAKRNIAAFYKYVTTGAYGNDTTQRSVDCTLTAILGREAARRGALLTMDELVKENKRLEVDLKGLKA